MIRFGTLIVLGVVIGSISFSMFWFIDNLTVDVTSESGEPVKIDDIMFDVQFVSYHEILKKNKMHEELKKVINFALDNYPNKKELIKKLKILKNEIRI